MTVHSIPNVNHTRVAVWARTYIKLWITDGPTMAQKYLERAVPDQFWDQVKDAQQRHVARTTQKGETTE